MVGGSITQSAYRQEVDMSRIAVFLAVGFEEIEAVSTIDVLRRGGMEVDMISVSGNIDVEGAHGIIVRCDLLFYNVDYTEYDVLVLPGGMPGTENLSKHEGLLALIPDFINQGKKVAAICAAPMILGQMGLLEGKTAICYPGFEDYLEGAHISFKSVEREEQIITAKGAGVAMAFGLEILKWFLPFNEVAELKDKLVLN